MSTRSVDRSGSEHGDVKQGVVVLFADAFYSDGVEELSLFGCSVKLDPSLMDGSLVDAIASLNPDILVVRSTRVTNEMLDASERLSVVIRAGAGYDTIDVDAASKRGVFVANCPGKNSIAVAELAWSLILSCDRRIPDQVTDLRRGVWNKKEYSDARGLHGRTLGVIGLGGVGLEVAKRGIAFGMNVVAWSRSLTDEKASKLGIYRCKNLLDLAKTSDVVTVHVSATPDTEGLIDAAFLAAMKDCAIFVNTSRGKVIDEAALVCATQDKQLRVGLDVYADEPTTSEGKFSPKIIEQVCVYGTHHVGASTQQSQDSIASEVLRIVKSYVTTGIVPNCVNRAQTSHAKALLSVRHRNLPGVLAHVFESISLAGVNVEEMENIIYEGASAACARIQLDDQPTPEQIATIRENENILGVIVSIIN